MCQQAIEGVKEHPCLWLRGILPSEFTQIPSEHANPPDELILNFVNPEFQIWGSGTYYGDASGGENTHYQSLRRVGVAVVFCVKLGVTSFGVSSNLPGSIQTVGRGEVFALVLLLQNLDHHVQVEFVTDNLNLYNTYCGGKKAAVNAANCDLFNQIYELIEYKQIQLEVRWMPSHTGKLAQSARPVNVSHFDVLANHQADHYAGAAAKAHQIDKDVAIKYLKNVALMIDIQKRNGVILVNLPDRDINKRNKPDPVKRVKFDDLLKDTTHKVSIKNMVVKCKLCLNAFSMQDPACKHWLKTRCQPIHTVQPQVLHKPIPLTDQIHLGRQITHVSHKLVNYRGIVYCSKCGTRAGKNQIRYLAKPCQPPELAGFRLLACIENGKLPAGCTSWPDDNVVE